MMRKLIRLVGLLLLPIGLAITSYGAYLEFSSYGISPQELLLAYTFFIDLGPGMLTASIVLLLVSRRRSFYNPLTYGLLVSAGIWIASIFYTMPILIGGYSLPTEVVIMWEMALFSIAPSLISSATLAFFIASKEWQASNYSPDRTTMDKVISVSIVGGLVLPYAAGLLLGSLALLKILLIAIGTWAVWHIFSPWLAARLLLGFTRKTFRERMKSVEFRFEGVMRNEVRIGALIDRSYYPMAASLGLVLTYLNVQELIFPLIESLDPISAGARLVNMSFIALVLASIFVGPIFWVIRSSGVRAYDKRSGLEWKLSLPPSIRQFIEFYSVIQGVVGFGLIAAKRDPVFSAIVLALILSTIFLASFLATVLYHVLSLDSSVRRFLERCWRLGVALPDPEKTYNKLVS